MKSLWKKILETLSYIFLIGFVYKLFIRKPVSTQETENRLKSISEPFEADLESSQQQFEDEMGEINDEKSRIKDLNNRDLAREFDSEF